MHPDHTRLLIILVAATSFLASHGVKVQPPGNASGLCIPHERNALLIFKQGIASDPAGLLDSWQGGAHDQLDCCKWRGVRCSNRTGHVLRLRLRSDFDDPIIAPMVGQISHSLLSLERLEHLDLSGNSLQGSDGHIPKFLGSLKNLKYLDLSSIPFSGKVPPHLGNLSNLQYLDLSSTEGTHSTDVSWLGHLPFLQYLNLCGVNLSATGGWPHAVNMIPSLRDLYLSGCSLKCANQSLPCLNLTNLETLDLSSNYFDHPIASSWFWNITHLKHLNLYSTGLYGPLPLSLQDMVYLEDLDISQPLDNKPKCTVATNLRNLCNLEVLHMGSKLLYGDIKELLESLPHCQSNRLRELDLTNNNISGVLPNQMRQLTNLERLDLSRNNIRGILPSWMGQLTGLKFLGLSGNNISGPIPNWIGQLTSLEFLGLARNNISGVIPDLMARLTSLNILDLAGNISGPISNWIGQLTSLEFLGLARNNISGVIPDLMARLTSLNILDLAGNNITGPLPSFVGHFTSLSYVDLSYNHLTGQVPYEIGMLGNVSYLNINHNDLDGTITEEHFAGLKSLQWVDLSANSLKILISSEWQPPFTLMEGHFGSCQMGPKFPSWLKWMVDIDRLDISNTSIDDHLPDWFCSTFSKVTYLSIANNQIRGGLPANMESMSLIQLFLGSNQLMGKIPLMPTSLTTLDLSNNYFSGPLP